MRTLLLTAHVLDEEPGINAFVAGLRPTEAVLVVTRGALAAWNRDELQGVIGHEYSHIFNGDMRLNVRLMGILAGILLIGQIGRALMRSSGRSRGKGSGQVVFLGLALFIIGSIGIFFGSLIKAAVSRQREYLADASAAQYTRNPRGLAQALEKLRDAKLPLRKAARGTAHLFFVDPLDRAVNYRDGKVADLLASHPPIERRIELLYQMAGLSYAAARRAAVPSSAVMA